jgi:FtsP/CotA-like multicopper oxidase with cupredoxin domain
MQSCVNGFCACDDQVDETPGTYWWHDHSVSAEADGLSGPLIVKPAASVKEPFTYNSSYILYLEDWYHVTGVQQSLGLNRCPPALL